MLFAVITQRDLYLSTSLQPVGDTFDVIESNSIAGDHKWNGQIALRRSCLFCDLMWCFLSLQLVQDVGESRSRRILCSFLLFTTEYNSS